MRTCVVCEFAPLKTIICNRVKLFGGKLVEDAGKAHLIITTSAKEGREALEKHQKAKIIMALSSFCDPEVEENEARSLKEAAPEKVKICRLIGHRSQHQDLFDHLLSDLERRNRKRMKLATQ